MKFIVSILLIAFLSFVAGLYLPWWSIALAAFIVSIFISQKPAGSFWAGFLGVFLLWFFLALKIDIANDHILSKKIAEILPLSGSYFLLTFITALVGGLVGGFAALAGSYSHARRRRTY